MWLKAEKGATWSTTTLFLVNKSGKQYGITVELKTLVVKMAR